jgi:SAM-dependent methyltransferase
VSDFDRSIGRHAFGADPAGYDGARPDYPQRVYDILARQCGLRAGARVFEVGPGPGKATRQLLTHGAQVHCIEPDERSAQHLRTVFGGSIEVDASTFEDAVLSQGAFDLGVAATSFHWVEPEAGLTKVLAALKPGGAWAMWWNHYGDPEFADPLYRALQPLYAGLPRRIYRHDKQPPPLGEQMERRHSELVSAGFADIGSEIIRSPLALDTAQVQALYGSFSEISTIDAASRERFLRELGAIIDTQFGGRIERVLVTSMHWGSRPA